MEEYSRGSQGDKGSHYCDPGRKVTRGRTIVIPVAGGCTRMLVVTTPCKNVKFILTKVWLFQLHILLMFTVIPS